MSKGAIAEIVLDDGWSDPPNEVMQQVVGLPPTEMSWTYALVGEMGPYFSSASKNGFLILHWETCVTQEVAGEVTQAILISHKREVYHMAQLFLHMAGSNGGSACEHECTVTGADEHAF